jgi:hypothetical protein
MSFPPRRLWFPPKEPEAPGPVTPAAPGASPFAPIVFVYTPVGVLRELLTLNSLR